MKRPDPKAVAFSVARGVGASLAKPSVSWFGRGNPEVRTVAQRLLDVAHEVNVGGSVNHSGSAAGNSSYITVGGTAEVPERFTIRVSDHGVGPHRFHTEGHVHVDPSDADSIAMAENHIRSFPDRINQKRQEKLDRVQGIRDQLGLGEDPKENARIEQRRYSLEGVPVQKTREEAEMDRDSSLRALRPILKRASGGPAGNTLLDSTGKPVHHTPEGVEAFKRWFGDSKSVDEQNRPVVLYRGVRGNVNQGIYAGALDAEPKNKNWATFATTSPSMAATYGAPDFESDEVGALMPVYVKADKLIEFPVRKTEFGNTHDKFEFDMRASRLSPGEVLVARNVVDTGPRTPEAYSVDKEKQYSYPADIYAWGPGTEVKSAVGNDGTFDHPTDITKAAGGEVDEHGIAAPEPFDIDAAKEQYLTDTAGINRRPLEGHDPRLLFHTSKEEQSDDGGYGPEDPGESTEQYGAFDPDRSELGIHVGSRDQAEGRINRYAIETGSAPRTLPVYVAIKNPIRLQDFGTFDWHAVLPQLERQNVMSFQEAESFLKNMQEVMEEHGALSDETDKVGNAYMREFLLGKGYDSAVYLNRFEGVLERPPAPGKSTSISPPHEHTKPEFTDEMFKRQYPGAHDSYILFKPTQAKSMFATEYNPDKDDLSKAAGGEVGSGLEGMELHALNPEHARDMLEVRSVIGKAGGGGAGDGKPVEQPKPQPRKLNNIGLYSHAAEQALKLPQAKGSLGQMLQTLKNKGVKQDEIDHSDVTLAFLNQPSVTREELADHFSMNIPEISPDTSERQYRNWTLKDPRSAKLAGKNYREHLLQLTGSPDHQKNGFNDSHWSGVKNILVHLRTQDFSNQKPVKPNWEKPKLDTFANISVGNRPGEYEQKRVPAAESGIPGLVVNRPLKGKPHLYNLTHVSSGLTALREVPYHVIRQVINQLKSLNVDFEQDRDALLASNPVEAKTLLKNASKDWERLYPAPPPKPSSKPVSSALLIDELQSDWGQRARKYGIIGSDEHAKRKQQRDFYEQKQKEFDNKATEIEKSYFLTGQYEEALKRSQPFRNAQRAYSHLASESDTDKSVPDGPFIGSTEKWADLGLKYALKKAADEGHTHLVWTPSQVQTNRYSQEVPKLIDSFRVFYEPISDSHMVMAYKDGKYVNLGQKGGMYSKPEKLAEMFGKELASLLTSNNDQNKHLDDSMQYQMPVYTYDLPQGISIGKSGHQFMYDKLMPKRLLALAQQHDPDAKITSYDGPHEAIKGFPALEITPAMRESIKTNGFKAFRRGGKVVDVDAALRVARKARGLQ